MTAPHPLVSRFATAGLRAALEAPRFLRDGADAFHLAIARPRREPARFQIWPGAAGNRVEVLDADARLRQVLLFVDEPRRWVTVQWSRFTPRPTPGPDVRVLDDSRGLIVERRTPGGRRRFLAGRDERDLFIAEIPAACSTVRDAREALRPAHVALAARSCGVVRQGEWFFVEPTPQELRELEAALARRAALVETHRNVGAVLAGGPIAGNPHTADEVVVVRGPTLPDKLFVRGRVRHRDHATVRFRSWRLVFRNAERTRGGVAWASGVTWVD